MVDKDMVIKQELLYLKKKYYEIFVDLFVDRIISALVSIHVFTLLYSNIHEFIHCKFVWGHVLFVHIA